jgi:hypothetical protein
MRGCAGGTCGCSVPQRASMGRASSVPPSHVWWLCGLLPLLRAARMQTRIARARPQRATPPRSSYPGSRPRSIATSRLVAFALLGVYTWRGGVPADTATPITPSLHPNIQPRQQQPTPAPPSAQHGIERFLKRGATALQTEPNQRTTLHLGEIPSIPHHRAATAPPCARPQGDIPL